MSSEDGFWAAHDQHRDRINSYLTLALDNRLDELLTMVSADFDTLDNDARFDLIVGLVGALATITEQAADAGGQTIEDYLQHHLLDVEEMIDRRSEDQEPEER